MKTLITISFALLHGIILFAQTQLDVQGSISSTDTVAKIRVNSTIGTRIVGLSVYSSQFDGEDYVGTAGYFYGGGFGVYGKSTQNFGVYGRSSTGTGVFGYSQNGRGITGLSTNYYGVLGTSTNAHGSYFEGANGNFGDIILGGSNYYGGYDDGVIMSEPNLGGSDIFLVSNDAIILELDNNGGQTGNLQVWNTQDRKVLVMLENGQFEIWNGASSNNRRMLLEPDGDLFIDGTLGQGSDRNRKENIKSIDPDHILDLLIDVPVTTWNYIGDDTPHMGPMAQDFHTAFGLGVDDTTIAVIDVDGVALAAIQALHHQNKNQQSEIDQLKDEIALVKQMLLSKSGPTSLED